MTERVRWDRPVLLTALLLSTPLFVAGCILLLVTSDSRGLGMPPIMAGMVVLLTTAAVGASLRPNGHERLVPIAEETGVLPPRDHMSAGDDRAPSR